MTLIQDCRIINLNSQDAIRLNGDRISNVIFPIKNLIKDDEFILYSTIGIINAQIANSWYLINNSNCFLYINALGNDYTLELTKGNYNSSTLFNELILEFANVGVALLVSINKINGILTFTFDTTVSLYPSIGLFRILGFEDITYTGATITPPFPLNLLGVKKLKINSAYLATQSYDSSNQYSGDTIDTIPVDVPSFSLITFANYSSTYGKMRLRRIDTIDIQILDEYNNLLEFNNIDWSITLQLIIFRMHRNDTDVLAIDPINPIPEQIQEEPTTEKPKPTSDLDILQYGI